MDLNGKTIVITGAARGLGREMALTLAREGVGVALVDLDAAELDEAVRLCEQAGERAKGYPVDVTDEAAVETLFATIVQDFGRIDGLINNAGITRDGLLVKAKEGKVVGKMSLADFQTVIDVDLTAPFLCGREAAMRMIEGNRAGVIINISSVSRAGNTGQCNYSAAKAGLAAMTVTWAKELARHGIRAAGIAPGFSNTRMVSSIPARVVDGITSSIPAHRFAEPAEIADAVLFILRNDYYNGRTLEIDGGLRL